MNRRPPAGASEGQNKVCILWAESIYRQQESLGCCSCAYICVCKVVETVTLPDTTAVHTAFHDSMVEPQLPCPTQLSVASSLNPVSGT